MEANVSLLDQTHCDIILATDAGNPMVSLIAENRELRILSTPSLTYFLQDNEVEAYPWNKSFEEARFTPFVVLQTSGSTGLPKAVVVNHGALTSMDSYHLITHLGSSPVVGPSLKDTRMFMAFPLYHMASFTLLLGLGAYYGVVGVLPPAVEPLTASFVDNLHEKSQVQGSALPPSLLADLYNDECLRSKLPNLRYIFYAGGSLPDRIGNGVSKLTHLATLFGSTETAYPPARVLESSEWQYISYSPFYGDEFRAADDGGLYEHFIVRKYYLDLFQGVFATFPELEEYSTKDFYRQHPSKAGLWKFCGRADEVIVLSNAEKFNPGHLEDTLNGHPSVKSALVAGQGEFQPCLLIESAHPTDEMEAKVNLLNEIWPTIEQVNSTQPSYARIMKDFVIFTSSQKPVSRAGKGTVQKFSTLQNYLDEIKALYQNAEMPKVPLEVLVKPEAHQSTNLREALFHIVSASVWLKGQLTYDADFFDLGLDSLQALAMTRQLNAYIMQAMPDMQSIAASDIYTYSNVDTLSKYLETANRLPATDVVHQQIEETFNVWKSRLSKASAESQSSPEKSQIVLLTGSTGSLGSYILHDLLSDSSVQHVYCLNRGSDAEQRQRKSFAEKGLSLNLQRARFVQYDLRRERMGLDEELYNQMSDEVTHIVHNAWDVNFNRPFESFIDAHIRGVSSIIELCVTSKRPKRLLFMSSEGAVSGENTINNQGVTEAIRADWSCAQRTGYAQSKLVAENLVVAACQNAHLQACICRVGQIGGPTHEKGLWNQREWFPSLVASSVRLSMIPNHLLVKDEVDWIPIDLASGIIVELLFNHIRNDVRLETGESEQTDGQNIPSVYHVVNPHSVPWQSLLPDLQEAIPSNLNVVSVSVWLDKLREEYPNWRESEQLQALALLDFFTALGGNSSHKGASLSTEHTTKMSPKLAELQPVNQAWMRLWVEQWGLMGTGNHTVEV